MSDPFSKATSSFVNNDDLEGRVLLIRPDEVGSRPSKTDRTKSYEYIVADVAVLTGPATDKIESVPGILDGMQLTGGSVVALLKGKIGKANEDGSRKLVLGVMTKVPSQTRGQNDAWVLAEPDDDAVASARAYLAKDETILAKGKQAADPFA